MVTDTVLITGCSSGIGRETAFAFADDGWTVYATAREESDIEELRSYGCETAELDVTDDADISRVVDRILDEAGHIDCLVNNAGYGQLGPIEDVPVEKVKKQFEVNVFGPHRLVREVLPHMREQESGAIVNVSSVAGRVSMPGMGVYSGSKFAMEAMSDALRPEVASFGVDVVLVEPGPVETAFTDRVEDEVEAIDRSGAYGTIYRILNDSEAIGGGGPGAVRPIRVADTILHAASCRHPDARYPVGLVAKYGVLARFVPDNWRDKGYPLLDKVLNSGILSRLT